jgi:hypothetical protein
MGNIFDSSLKVPAHKTSFCVVEEILLFKQLKSFWEFEEPTTRRHLCPGDEQCEKYFLETVLQDEKGWYIVSLPFKEELRNL